MFEIEKLKILPYYIEQGTANLSDYYLSNYLTLIKQDDLEDIYFHDIEINNNIWMNLIKRNTFIAVEYDYRPCGFALIRNVKSKIGFGNFLAYKWIWGSFTEPIGKTVLKLLMTHYNILFGLSPVTNEIAIKYQTDILGFKYICDVPKACYLKNIDEWVDGALTIYGGFKNEDI